MQSYPEALEYLYTRLPMFTRIGAAAINKSLKPTLQFCAHLGNPHQKFKAIHVGGTNGKGSTSHMLAAILQMAGYKTGLFTSPHLLDFRERIRINGKVIAEEEVINFVKTHKLAIEDIKPSFFEVTAVMAFDYFNRQKVDIAIIEVGLGGRLDATNIIHPLLSIITNISFDHIDILGNTLKKIAVEKAGIIKPMVPVVIGEWQEEVAEVFLKKSKDMNAAISFASKAWEVEPATDDQGKLSIGYLNIKAFRKACKNDDATLLQQFSIPSTCFLSLDQTGAYQLKNVATVLCAVDNLCKQGFPIEYEHTRSALQQVRKLTGLHGRWQKLGESPLIICDTGHNSAGIAEVVKNICATRYHKLHMVIGMVKDKDSKAILKLLPARAYYYFCQPNVERAKPSEELAMEALEIGLKGKCYASPQQALQAANDAAKKDDLIFIGGSTFVVSELITPGGCI